MGISSNVPDLRLVEAQAEQMYNGSIIRNYVPFALAASNWNGSHIQPGGNFSKSRSNAQKGSKDEKVLGSSGTKHYCRQPIRM
jgi:hypothetical protein